MADKAQIISEVNSLVKKFCSRDPFKLCNNLDIRIIFKEYPKNVKGYYIKMLDTKFIILNKKLPPRQLNVVVAHELGHALVHDHSGGNFLIHSGLFPVCTMEEIEANCFAAELIFYDLDGSVNKRFLDTLDLQEVTDLVAYKSLNLDNETNLAREYLHNREENERCDSV